MARRRRGGSAVGRVRLGWSGAGAGSRSKRRRTLSRKAVRGGNGSTDEGGRRRHRAVGRWSGRLWCAHVADSAKPPVTTQRSRGYAAAADTAAMCHSAVMALFRADAPRRHGGPRRIAAGLDQRHGQAAAARTRTRPRGSRAMARQTKPVWTVVRRKEVVARGEHPCHAGSRPGCRGQRVAPQTGLAAPAGNGTPQPPRRTASAKGVEGQLAADRRIRAALDWQGERIVHHDLATPHPPRVRGARLYCNASPRAADAAPGAALPSGTRPKSRARPSEIQSLPLMADCERRNGDYRPRS